MWGATGAVVGFLALVVVNGFFDDDFAGVHLAAAVLLFVSLAMAVATHAWPGRLGGAGPGDRGHKVIFGVMAAGIPLALVLKFVFEYKRTVLALEAYEIAVFAVFWVREAVRTWDAPVPSPAAPSA